jgi:hypothetical protein
MTEFAFDAALLERAERVRTPVRRSARPGATPEEIDRATLFDREHSRGVRADFLDGCDAKFAESRGWMVSKKPSTVAAMYFGTAKVTDHGALPAVLQRLVDTTLRCTAFRSGAGSGIPNALLVHSTLPLAEITTAAGVLKTAGLRPEKLPFSVVNPRGAYALLIVKATRVQP